MKNVIENRGVIVFGTNGHAVLVSASPEDKPVSLWQVVEDAVLWRDPAELGLDEDTAVLSDELKVLRTE